MLLRYTVLLEETSQRVLGAPVLFLSPGTVMLQQGHQGMRLPRLRVLSVTPTAVTGTTGLVHLSVSVTRGEECG